MTDEQIKQNAEQYAEEHMVRTDGGGWEEEYDYEEQKAAYIAGAHSRDEEIKELQNELESLRKGFYEQGNKLKELIKKLMLANNKLRNPWISVEDRLPDIGQKVITITNKGKMLLVARTTQPPHKEEGGWRWEHYIGKVTHWMPIPELKKGE